MHFFKFIVKYDFRSKPDFVVIKKLVVHIHVLKHAALSLIGAKLLFSTHVIKF